MALPPNLQLQIVSAERLLVNETVDEVQIPGADGYLGVLPGHTPLLTTCRSGELWYRQGRDEASTSRLRSALPKFSRIAVTILAQIAERADEIDLARAEAAKRRAEERLGKPTVDMDFERARIALLKSLMRLHVASRARIRS